MIRPTHLLSLGFGLLVLCGCQGPELRRLNRQQVPVRMAVGLPAGLPERECTEAAYTKGLKDALSISLAVAEGQSTEPAPLITVEVAGRFNRSALIRDSVARGLRVGAGSSASFMAFELGRGKDLLNSMGNGVATGLGVGLLRGSLEQAYASSTYKGECKRLGYEPSLVKARVSFLPLGGDGPICLGEVDGLKVIALMRRLPEGEAADPTKRIEEEGRALGLAIWDLLVKEYSLVSREFLATKRS